MAPPSWRVGLIVPGCPNEDRDCGVSEFTAEGEACSARVVPRGDDNYPTPSGAARKGVRRLRFLRRIVEVPGQDLNGFCWKAELYHGAARHFCARGEANTTRAQLNLSLLRSSRTQYRRIWHIAHGRGRHFRATDPRPHLRVPTIASAGSRGSSRTRKRPANGMKQAQPSSTTSAVTADTRAITRRDRPRAAMTIM